MAIKFLSGLNLSNVTAGSILKLDSNGNIVAATAGTDYATSGTWSTASNSNIYYNSGGVRIGTYQASVDAAAQLHVFDYQTTDPKLLIEDGNTGDASMQFKISTQSYTMGIDNSDSDKFVLAASSALGTTNVLEVATNGTAAFQTGVTMTGGLTMNVGTNTVPISISGSSHKYIDIATSSNNQVGIRMSDDNTNFIVGLHGGEDSFKVSAHTSFGTNDCLTIETDGKVGIGTSSPSEKLHVVGDSVITGGLAVGEHTSINPNSYVVDAYRSSTATSGDTIGLHTLRYQWSGTNTGRVIGTYSAAQTSNTSTLTTAIGIFGTARHSSSGTLTNAYSLYLDSPSGSPTNAYNVYAAGTAKNYIGGNLGIGTSSPSAKLQVASTGGNGSAGLSDYGFVVTSSSTDQPTLGAESTGDGYANLNLGSNIEGTRRFWHISKRKATDAHKLSFYYYNGTGFSEPFQFRTNGGFFATTVYSSTVRVDGTSDHLTLRSDIQVDQGSTDPIIEFAYGTTQMGKFDQDGYMYAAGFKTTTASTGLLKADGTVDTTTLGTMASESASDYKDSDTVETYVATELASYTTTSSFGTNAFTSYTDHSTQGYLTALPSHNHDDRYYTETELNGFFKSITHQGNYISTANWSNDGSGSVASGWNAEGYPFSPTASFSRNGTDAENTRTVAELPNGAYGVVWRTPSNDSASDGDGGWDMDIYNVQHAKGYRSVVYFQKTDDSTSGTFYHGCHGSHTLNTNGTANNNPYFQTVGFSNLVENRWYVSIGYIQPYQYPTATDSGRSGIYDCYTGKKVVGGVDYMMKSGSTTQRHRTYQYYSTDPSSSINWWNPRFEEVNGNEPSIAELIQRVGIDGELGLNFHSKFPAGALDSLTEATDATNDKILLWDESADVWKQMTLEDLQDSIDQNTTYSVATTSADGLMSSSDKTKLDGVATGADVTPSWVPATDPSYLTSYTETDTLNSVVGRGASTTTTINTGDILPSADSTYDIGSNANKFAEGHFDHLYIGETANNPRIDIYTENATASIADTFTDTTTDKSYIYFQAGTNSNDPAYIMHETSEDSSPDERNEGVLHLVPSDDNSTGDYVSIHGTNDADCIKLHTSGLIETASGYQLTLKSGNGNLRIDDDVEVNQYIRHYGDSDTYISFEDNRVKIVAGNVVKFDSDTIYTGTVQSVTGTGTVSGLTLSDDGDGTDPTLTLGGSITTPVSGDWWNDGFVKVQTDGVMEVGKYIDFHETDAGTSDYDYRMYLNSGTMTFSGDALFQGGDVYIVKQNDAPTLTLLHDGTNPSTNDLLFKMQFQSDYEGTHQNWGKIICDTNNSSVRTNLDFFVKSTSGNEELGFRIEGQPSATPKAYFYNDVNFSGDLIAGGNKYTLTVNAPTNVTTSVVNETINVTFTASTTADIDNYLVFSSVAGGDYGLISVIPPADFGATMSIIDNSFDSSGLQAYRVYAVKNGVYSSPATSSRTYTVTTPLEPTNMSVVNLNSAYYIQWDEPSTNARFVTAYNVYKHEASAQASLSRSSATLIYSGTNTSYMYQISGADNNNYHQFWVETTVG